MGRIKGITITLIESVEKGRDDFGHPIFEEVETLVDNVLISPSSTEDITSQMNLTGRKAEYTLAIPKGDLHDWENKEVLFFGKRWKTFGVPLEGIEEMLPLAWNKKVMVERYE